MVFFVLFILAIVCLVFWTYSRKEQARGEYESALSDLRAKPHDTAKYNAALRAAQSLADRTRPEHTDVDTWRRSVRNEVEIIRLQATKSVPSEPRPSIETRLRKLTELFSEGLITGEEHDERRREILEEV